MPENTWIYDTVWEEYRVEHKLSDDEMNEFIWTGNREVIKDLESRANKMMWQMDQRSAWMCGDEPLYRVPEDCPFWCVPIILVSHTHVDSPHIIHYN